MMLVMSVYLTEVPITGLSSGVIKGQKISKSENI